MTFWSCETKNCTWLVLSASSCKILCEKGSPPGYVDEFNGQCSSHQDGQIELKEVHCKKKYIPPNAPWVAALLNPVWAVMYLQMSLLFSMAEWKRQNKDDTMIPNGLIRGPAHTNKTKRILTGRLFKKKTEGSNERYIEPDEFGRVVCTRIRAL